MIYPNELITPTFKEGQTMKRIRQKTSIARGGGGGGLNPYITHIGMCRPKGYGFCAVLVRKRV